MERLFRLFTITCFLNDLYIHWRTIHFPYVEKHSHKIKKLLLTPPWYLTLYVDHLKRTQKGLQPSHSRSQQRDSHMPTALQTRTHVFVRRDAVSKPLQPPYDGPFKVISRSPKHFGIDLETRTNTISIDRLKCAHMDTAISPITSNNQPASTPYSPPSPLIDGSSPVRQTRSGCPVHFPKRYVTIVPC